MKNVKLPKKFEPLKSSTSEYPPASTLRKPVNTVAMATIAIGRTPIDAMPAWARENGAADMPGGAWRCVLEGHHPE